MIQRVLVLAVLAALGACASNPSSTASTAKTDTGTPVAAASAAQAEQFIGDLNKRLYPIAKATNTAQWVAATYVNQDTQLLSAQASDQLLAFQGQNLNKADEFRDVEASVETERALHLLKAGNAVLPPKDPAHRSELTVLAAKLDAAYASGKDCKDPSKPETCRDLLQLSEVLAKSRKPAEMLDAWLGWHNTARASRPDYVRFVERQNEGARDYGFKDAGELWRGGYDMSAGDFAKEADRLYSQVEPLYRELHCYTRAKLHKKYGAVVPATGPVPAHVLGNMWAQSWAEIWDVLEPYPGIGSLDVTAAIAKKGWDAQRIVKQAEDFYVSLDMPKLPESFWQRSQFVQPRDREVQCHASAWDIDMKGDVRIKMCIKPTEEELRTAYHELGHVYYFLAYNAQPPLFQSGAHDGFHEAIGDTILLSLTPGYMNQVGLIDKQQSNEKALINQQMKMALDRIAFLPFSKLVDEWRWRVFSGEITPENYNAAWWELRRKFQGVTPPVERTEADFDAGAKYHVPGNTPYTRYFLSFIIQFQFHKALCEAAGNTLPLHECSVYGNKAAGAKYWAMLQKGASQPWQKSLKELTGGEQMDGSAIVDYFAPLQAWLKKENAGQTCGW